MYGYVRNQSSQKSINFISAEILNTNSNCFKGQVCGLKLSYTVRQQSASISVVASQRICFMGNTFPAVLPVVMSLLSRIEKALVILDCVKNCM